MLNDSVRLCSTLFGSIALGSLSRSAQQRVSSRIGFSLNEREELTNAKSAQDDELKERS